MFRYFVSALAGAVFLVCNAVAEPTMQELQASARWSTELQSAMQIMVSGIGNIDQYQLVLEDTLNEAISEKDALDTIAETTSSMKRGLADYVYALKAMPPHPMTGQKIGESMQEAHGQMLAQADMLEKFIDLMDTLSREAVLGNAGAAERMGGEVMRVGAMLLGTDVAIIRTQTEFQSKGHPSRNLNLGGSAELQFSREMMLFQATRLFGSSPGISDGNLDAADGYVSDALREIAEGRKNVSLTRSKVLQEKLSKGGNDPMYGLVEEMLASFAADWTRLEVLMQQARALVQKARASSDDFDIAFDQYMADSSEFTVHMLDSQSKRTRLLSQ